MKKKLAIICAGTSQLPLVFKAKEIGVETHCFAWDREGYTQCKGIADYFHPISILEKEQILEKCREINIDGIASIANDYAVPIVAFVAQEMNLPGNCYEDMLIAGNKFTMRQAFLKHGVKSPRFTIVHDGVDLSSFKYPLIVKATDRNCSIGVIKVEKEEDLQNAIKQARELSFIDEVIVEEFITGAEAGVETISWNGEHHILAIKERVKTIVNNTPCRMATHLPFELASDIHDKVIIETKKAMDSFNFKYGAGITELNITDNGEVYVIETTPRMGGSTPLLLKLHNGYDIVKGVIDVALGQFEKPIFTHKKYSGEYICRENTENIKRVIENKENDPDIVKAVFFNESFLGKIGHFFYQSEQKRRWT